MKGLIKEGTRPYAYQRAIPSKFQNRFDGKKKFSVSLDTHEHDEAVRRAQVAARDFEARCGLADGPVFNLGMIAGLLFDRVFNRPEMAELRESVQASIAEFQDDNHPLVNGLPSGGPSFDELVKILEHMCVEAELHQVGRSQRPRRVSRTLYEQATAWRKLPSPLSDKTRDQYVKDAADFTRWYVSAVRETCIGAAISKKDVNAYVESRMKANEPKATIKRRLAGLTKIYKSGQFSDDNPFAGVTDRIDIHGPELEVRPFTDSEVQKLFKEMIEFDINVQWATRIAAYSGMRLAEICSIQIPDIASVMIGKEKVYYFNLLRQNGRRLKTEASYRYVPIHPSYRDDLLKFIKGKSGYLLDESDANKYKSRSAAISKRMNRLIDRITDDPEAREHSFRHTVVSKLSDAGVREELRRALVGHKGSDPHDGYNHAMRIRELSTAIRTIQYEAS